MPPPMVVSVERTTKKSPLTRGRGLVRWICAQASLPGCSWRASKRRIRAPVSLTWEWKETRALCFMGRGASASSFTRASSMVVGWSQPRVVTVSPRWAWS